MVDTPKEKRQEAEDVFHRELDRISKLSGEDLTRELVRQLIFLNLRLQPLRAILVQADGTIQAAAQNIRSAIADLKGVILTVFRGKTGKGQ